MEFKRDRLVSQIKTLNYNDLKIFLIPVIIFSIYLGVFNFIVQEFSGFFKPGMNCTLSGLVSIFFLCGWGGEIRSNKKRQLLVSPLLRTVRVPFKTYGSSILIRIHAYL